MKFRDGYWQIKKGVRQLNLAAVLDAALTEDSLSVYTASKQVVNRGEGVDLPLLTTVFSSPLPDIIHVRMYHHKGGIRRGPEFTVLPDGAKQVTVEQAGDGYTVKAGALSAEVAGKSWKTVFTRGGKRLTEISGRNSGYFTVPAEGIAGGEAHCKAEETFMVQYLNLSVGETVYGLGERFTSFVKNGQVVDIWNEDGGTCSEQAYKNIPFYVTNRGYGVLVNNPGKVSFEVASEVVTAVQFSVPGEIIDYYLIAGDSLKDVFRNYTALTGRPALPPAWSFGLWLSTSFTTDYDEKTVSQFIDEMARHNIPLGVFHFDALWMKECQLVDFEWDKAQFPEPAAMLGRLKKRGIHICVWINPYIAQKSRLFDEGMEKGYLVKKANGDVWQWDRWQSGMGLVDFTNPAAAAWYTGELQKLLDMGVDTFKTDFGERIPTDVVYYNGADPQGMHNYYTYLYNKAVFGLLEKVKGRGNALVFARSATVGGQQFPIHWGGDCSASYESMEETLRGGLSFALSGFSFWSHDISGFENTATPDLFKRWAAFGLLSTHSRLHGNHSYRMPWYFDDEAGHVLRFFVELKNTLMPYLFRYAVQSSEEGIPMMRAMVLEYTGDPACTWLDRQYMLGDSLLVAPIFSETGIVSYYLPPGRWTNLISGELIQGGAWRTEQHGYLSLPLLVKPNSIIPLGNNTQKPDYDYTSGLSFHVFEPEPGKTAGARVCNTRGETELELEMTRQEDICTFDLREINLQSRSWSICLRGIHRYRSLDGASAQDGDQGLVLNPAPGIQRITLRL
ncbi:MAG: alpha-xylosidase [Spirochaetaceae bacterium]|jgi:alpha-D-xyloside xylohydrolase|nr:alpha-xylosidase [Spirochaetaceae bacterium]